MKSWPVYVIYPVLPCGCTKTSPSDKRMTYSWLDKDNVYVDVAECLTCGATWDELDDLEYAMNNCAILILEPSLQAKRGK